MAPSEAEAAATVAATLPLTITIMRARRRVRPVMPVLSQANARLATTIRRAGPQGRQLLRVMPTIQRRAVGNIMAASRAGLPVTAPLAVLVVIIYVLGMATGSSAWALLRWAWRGSNSR